MRESLLDTADRLGLTIDLTRLASPPATPAEAAAAVGCDERQITSSTVFIADGDPILCIARGGARVDQDLLADALDVVEVRPATSAEVRAATGFCEDGVPPFGHELPVVLDEPVLEHETIWTAGGDGRCILQIAPRLFVGATAARVATVTVAVGV